MLQFVRNTWYLAAWSDALAVGAPLTRTIVGVRILLYRTPGGVAVALEDRCPHRLAPLSRGRFEGDGVVCGYHGLAFGPDGQCRHNPHGGRIPPAATVRAFPVVERHGAVWIWTGRRPEDASAIPDFSILDGARGAAALRRDHMVMQGPWDLITDNLLDLSHVNFLHEGILGNAAMVAARNEVEQRGGTLTVTRRSGAVPPAGMFDMLFRQDGQPVDAWMAMRWDAPAAMLLDVGVTGVGEPREAGTGYFGIHILTPETARTTHYHFAAVRWNIRPDSETEAMRQRISDLRRYAFAEQDMPMIAAQAANWETAGPDYQPLAWLDIDVGVARWRRIVQERLDAESAPDGTGPPGASAG